MSGTNVMLFRSTDTGAPVLSGMAGAVIAILDACLKDGYNSKTVNLARTGSVATATCATAHGYASDGLTKINISGAEQTEYNGDFQISNVTALTFDFTVTGTPATPATGTISAKVAPIGWGKPFSGTNKAVYRSAESTATRLYLRVDDTGTTSARAIGYEEMTDVDTGTGLFPTAAQLSGGLYINKSQTADATARPWVLIGDGYEFNFYGACSSTRPNRYPLFNFGDPASEMASDPYGCLIIGQYGVIGSGSVGNYDKSYVIASTASLAGQSGHYFARNYTQTGTSVGAGKHGNYLLGGANIGSQSALLTYPAPSNNGLYVAPIFVSDSSVIRAQLKSLYQPLHYCPIGLGNVVPANVSPIGRKLYPITINDTDAALGEIHIDIDGPWR